MCILFLYYCDKPSADGYRLIVASNRDEYYDRPTARATFWEKNPKIIAGKINLLFKSPHVRQNEVIRILESPELFA